MEKGYYEVAVHVETADALAYQTMLMKHNRTFVALFSHDRTLIDPYHLPANFLGSLSELLAVVLVSIVLPSQQERGAWAPFFLLRKGDHAADHKI